GGAIEEVLAARERMAAEVESLGGAQGRLTERRAELAALLAEASQRARALSAARKEAATKLGRLIGKELEGLGMGRARGAVDVARHRQVLCITHLPSIAAFADAHFVVQKGEQAGVAVTQVARVAGRERLSEIARMLAGAKVTPAARRAAEEMLRGAGQSRASD